VVVGRRREFNPSALGPPRHDVETRAPRPVLCEKRAPFLGRPEEGPVERAVGPEAEVTGTVTTDEPVFVGLREVLVGAATAGGGAAPVFPSAT
jgi:hypothetical protein